MMIKQKWMLSGTCALLAWVLITPGLAYAVTNCASGYTTTAIYPVNPLGGTPLSFSLNTNSPVTVSIYDNTGTDVTCVWLPDWTPLSTNQTVYVVVNSGGGTAGNASLVPPLNGVTVTGGVFNGTSNPFLNPAASPPLLTTSAYPGQCTNYGLNTDLSADFILGAPQTVPGLSIQGYPLTSKDCGGMAVIQVPVTFNGTTATYTFILPQDSNFNGMPDIWENQNGWLLIPGADIDTGPEGNIQVGDGISNFDEYRGFIVSGSHIRTNPRQKDLFVHLVNPQCSTATGSVSSLLGGGPVTYPMDNLNGSARLFDILRGLIPGSQIHLLGYKPGQSHAATNEWIDHFAKYDVDNGFTYFANSDGPKSDRRININALYPVYDSVIGSNIQKGLRITECLDESVLSLLGSSGWGSANGPGNALIFTRRIVDYITDLIGSNTTIQYVTYIANGSRTKVVIADANMIISKAIEYYLAMEIGHGVALSTTNSTSYGFHKAPGTGDVLDQAIKAVANGKGTITFYIPSVYGSADRAYFKLNN